MSDKNKKTDKEEHMPQKFSFDKVKKSEEKNNIKEAVDSKYRRVHITAEEAPEENEYYISVSRKFKLARYITLLVLILFSLVMISFYSEDITLENFRYLMKYFDEKSPQNENITGDIYYNTGTQLRLGVYKNDFVSADTSGINLHSVKGEIILSDKQAYSNPELVTSGRYLIMYDLGGYSYSIYNSFSRLVDEEYLYPISNAAMSDSGAYAIVTKAAGYRSAVYVYDRNFSRVGQIFKDKYIMNIAMSSTGEKLIIAYSQTTSSGEFETELVSYNMYSDTTEQLLSVSDSLAVDIEFHSNGSYSVVCDNQILFFDKNDNCVNKYSFNNKLPLTCLCENDRISVAFGENVIGYDYNILIFSPAGEVVFDGNINGKIVKFASSEALLFILCEGKVFTIDIASGRISEQSVIANAIDIFNISEDKIAVCTQSQATIYDMSFANAEDVYFDESTENTEVETNGDNT